MILEFRIAAAAAALCASMSVAAQEAPLPVQRAQSPAAPTMVLPANTKVLVQTNQELTTKGKTWSEGDSFDLSVIEDVVTNGYVVIPHGSKATGRIVWLTDKGMFGKSGKMELELEYVYVGERRVPINGTYRQEGEGKTVATVAGVLAAGPFAAVITGRSGVVPAGRELITYTESDLPLATSAPVSEPAKRAQIVG